MTKSYELEALEMKYEHQKPSIVTVSIELNQDTNARVKDLGKFGSFGYTKIYGNMTEMQRMKFILHIEHYIKLLFEEAEADVKFRQEWDELSPD